VKFPISEIGQISGLYFCSFHELGDSLFIFCPVHELQIYTSYEEASNLTSNGTYKSAQFMKWAEIWPVHEMGNFTVRV
jgi:hypothetical protein